MNADKFTQPANAVRIVKKTTDAPRTMLRDVDIERGAMRIAQGESLEAVATELAIRELALESAGMSDLVEKEGR